jgi:hypothetical protein
LAFRETCGGTADYFDPHDGAALAELMRAAIDDDGTWHRVASSGDRRLDAFAWRTSTATLAAKV